MSKKCGELPPAFLKLELEGWLRTFPTPKQRQSAEASKRYVDGSGTGLAISLLLLALNSIYGCFSALLEISPTFNRVLSS